MPRIIRTFPFPEKPVDLPERAIVITPNRAAASHLRVPFKSLQTLAKEILRRERIGIAPSLTSRHSLKRALRQVLHDTDESAEAGRIREILGAILRSGIDIDKLWRVGSPRVKTLARIAEKYVEDLWKMRMIDGEAALRTALNFKIEPKKLFIYGYFRARPIGARPEEVEFIDRIAGDGSVYYLPCTDVPLFRVNREWTGRLEQSGWEVAADDSLAKAERSVGTRLGAKFARGASDEEKESGSGLAQAILPFQSDSENMPANSAAIVYPSIEAEVRGTLAKAKNLLIKGTQADRIAVVCREPGDYAPMIASVSREFGVPVELNHEVPLGDKDIGNFVSLLLEAKQPAGRVSDLESADDEVVLVDTDSFDFETTARMLRHRYGPGIGDDKWHEARKWHTRGLAKWCELVEGIRCLESPEKQTVNAWIAWLNNILSEFGVPEKAAQNAAETTAFNCFVDALDEIGQIESERELNFGGFAANIYEILSDAKTPFDPRHGGIKLHQPNTIAGCEFEHVFVMGMAEGMLPEAVAENPVVDFYERKQLAKHGVEFEDATEVPRWETLSFYFVLLAASKSVTFSYPRYVNGEERLESSFFKRLGLIPVEAKTQFASSMEEHRRAFLASGTSLKEDAVFAFAKRQFDVEDRRESDAAFDEFDGVIGTGFDPAKRRWSASQLTKIGACPFKWFADKALRLGMPEEAETDLPANTKGSLYHKTLEIAVRNSIEALNIRAAVVDNLEAAFAEAESSEDFSLELVDNWELRRGEHLEKLRTAVSSAAFIADGSRVLAVEKEFQATWHGLTLAGKIDRIDETQDGLVAVDYKTGSYTGKVKDESGKLSIDLQLPIYSQAALPTLYPGKQVATGIYLRLAKGEAEKEKPVELDSFAESVKAILTEGRFAVDPDVDENACKYCEYESVCRRGPRLARKARKRKIRK